MGVEKIRCTFCLAPIDTSLSSKNHFFALDHIDRAH